MDELHPDLGIDLSLPATESMPRIRCSGTSWSHEPVFLTIRTASPLVLECPICQSTVQVDPSDTEGEADG